ncbi:MAG: glutathione S-transferase [Moraxellaceae bacterium]|nr:glutathione S-transferase [Moraxellaceae bacterium]
MKLIASLTSPFARKVRVVLQEKGLACELVVDIPWNADTTVPQFNPLGKVPVLLCDDNTTLFDSRVIVEYLEEVKPWPMLVPAEAGARLAVKRWEALADGVADAAATVFLERKRPAAQQSTEWIERQLGKIRLGLRAMNDDLGTRAFCVGASFSLADIATGCTLGYLDLRFPELGWRNEFPGLARLADVLALRTAFADTVPPA